MRRRFKKSVFTLIELMLVVSIIGILSSILMPSLMLAREKVKSAVCQANISQLMVGAISYADDWDGALPVYTSSYGSNWFSAYRDADSGVESGQVGRYLDDNLAVYYCPANPNPHYAGSGEGLTRLNSRFRDCLSYGVNRDSTAQAKIKIHEVPRTSDKLFFADSGSSTYGERANDARTIAMQKHYTDKGIFNRHEQSKANAAFIDGHVSQFHKVYLDEPASINS
jgi:prepilin-type N-terminal cleavage/methylation domain-containing protein/prepilin-type processing-associated H-X9-DG protein